MNSQYQGFTRHSRESGNPVPQGLSGCLGPRSRGGDVQSFDIMCAILSQALN